MRAGRSRSKRRKPSTFSQIREMVDPLQGGTGIMRQVPFYPLLITMLVSIGGYLGCDPRQVEQQVEQQIGQQIGQQINQQLGQGYGQAGGQVPTQYPAQYQGQNPGQYAGQPQGGGSIPGVPVAARSNPLSPTAVMAMPTRATNTLLIGSFNMQRLGPSKLSDTRVMEYFADIIRRFDVIALQEITSKDPNTVPTLLRYVNANGARYSFTISPPIGRSYFEQYAFVYDTARVTTRPDACFVVRDDEDLMHREPFVGRFATVANVANPFSFVLINVHTDPDLVDSELNTLAGVYSSVSNFFYSGQYPEDDVILLGDLNADPTRFRGLGQLQGVLPTIVGIPTNFTGTKTNDNILVNRYATGEFTGRSGALDLGRLYNLTVDQAKTISDHRPIWAEFSIQEVSGNQVAAQPNVSFMR